MVPGMVVARIDGNKWAVSVRGFNQRFGDKQLVLVDGRSVYTPLFSGVFWDAVDYPLEDIERVEVIRGPARAHGVPTPSTASSTSSRDGPKTRKADSSAAAAPARLADGDVLKLGSVTMTFRVLDADVSTAITSGATKSS